MGSNTEENYKNGFRTFVTCGCCKSTVFSLKLLEKISCECEKTTIQECSFYVKIDGEYINERVLKLED